MSNKMLLRTFYQWITLVVLGTIQVQANTNENDDFDFLLSLIYPKSRGEGVFDDELYESVLDTQMCNRQLNAMFPGMDPLQLIFLDASARVPSGMLTGNIFHLGNYFQCLNIDRHRGELHIQGKYCTILIPLDVSILKTTVPIPPGILENRTAIPLFPAMPANNASYALMGDDIHMLAPNMKNLRPKMLMAVCIPKPCTVSQALEFYRREGLIWLPKIYEEYFCRLPNDKLFRSFDFGVLGIFGFIFFVTILSTSYDLYNRFKLHKVPPSVILRSFSIYTNGQRLTTFTMSRDNISCIDGLRAISIMWVIFAHGHTIYLYSYVQNSLDFARSLKSYRSVMVSAAPISVDTFFTMSGLLATYTILRNIKKENFIKAIPVIYLHRMMHLFPLLWFMLLVNLSILPHLSDGPNYHFVARDTAHCRQNWLYTILHLQNYIGINNMCMVYTWYLASDLQLYLLSPLLLIFFYRSQHQACTALVVIILLSFVASSIYSYSYNLQAALSNSNRASQLSQYFYVYYHNTLPRSPPYLIGMAFGYALHQWQGKTCTIPKIYVYIFWIMTTIFLLLGVVPMWFLSQWQYDNQNYDNFYNAFNRGLWALGIGWLIFACVHGYGGPVNWFLSLGVWKLLARVSFALYLVHMTVIVTAAGSSTTTMYFSPEQSIYRFVGDFGISAIVAFFLTLFIDAPCSVLHKQIFMRLQIWEGGKKTTSVRKCISDVPSTDA